MSDDIVVGKERLEEFKASLLDALQLVTSLPLGTSKFAVRDLGQGQLGVTDERGYEWLVTVEK